MIVRVFSSFGDLIIHFENNSKSILNFLHFFFANKVNNEIYIGYFFKLCILYFCDYNIYIQNIAT